MPADAPLDGRIALARAQMAACRLCEHRCGVDRRGGPAGRCGAGDRPRFFRAAVSVADELDLGTCYEISLSGCNFLCAFCITGTNSQNATAGRPWAPAEAAEDAVRSGARSVMILGGEPAIHLPAALELARALAGRKPLVFKTNLYLTPDALDLVDGAFEMILADFKFGSDECARRLAAVDDYVAVVTRNLRRVRHGLRVRHLVMPGHIACCTIPVVDWLALSLPGVEFSLRHGFLPAHRAREHAELARPLRRREYAEALELAMKARLNLVA